MAGAVRLRVVLIPLTAMDPRVPKHAAKVGFTNSTRATVPRGVIAAMPVIMAKSEIKLTPKLLVGRKRISQPKRHRPTPDHASIGAMRLVLDSRTDRIDAALGVEPAASRAGGRAEMTVATIPRASDLARLTGSIEMSLTESAKYKSLIV